MYRSNRWTRKRKSPDFGSGLRRRIKFALTKAYPNALVKFSCRQLDLSDYPAENSTPTTQAQLKSVGRLYLSGSAIRPGVVWLADRKCRRDAAPEAGSRLTVIDEVKFFFTSGLARCNLSVVTVLRRAGQAIAISVAYLQYS